ncbi:MAG: hypothetical protein K2L14_06985 [Duncaniella sp.]|nr:hypothetical protein [Duncaniella sp.]
MAKSARNILCRAFVAPGAVIVNAVVSYETDTMRLLKVHPFEQETASTSHFDGIVVNGLPMNDVEMTVSVAGFRARLEEIAASLEKSDRIILVPLS